MSLRIAIDTVKYRNDLNQFVYRLNADSSLLLKEEMRLLLRDIQRLTPPKTLAQGRKAIAGDLRRVAAPLDPDKIKYRPLARAVRNRDEQAIETIASKMKRGFWANRKLLRSENEMKSIHLAARNNRGRVKNDQGKMIMLRAWNKYAKEVQDRVAFARAGWLAAAHGVNVALSSWIEKHAGAAQGSYKAPTPNDLLIVGTNRSSKIPNYQATVEAAMRNRVNSLGKELKRLLDGGKTRRASLAHTEYGKAVD